MSSPTVIPILKGDYKRGGVSNNLANLNVPPDHFIDSRNLVFTDTGVKTRPGLTKQGTIVPSRMFRYNSTNGTVDDSDRWIILVANGNFYDSGVSLAVPILTIANVTDFSMVVMYGRAYIAPLNTTKTAGTSGIYVYSGSGTARLAAGAKPATSVTVAASATAGNVEVGVHLISVAYETDSGFITKPATSTAFTVATAGFKLDISNIPTGPAGTSKRHLLATKRIVGYTGRPDDYELFFVPNGSIANNTATTLTIDFFDADLIDSADYLLDLYETLPTALGLTNYEGSLVLWRGKQATVADGATLYCSHFGSPEAISTIDGFVVIDPGDNGQVNNCVSFRKTLFAFKDSRTFAVQGDLSDSIDAIPPSQWPVTRVDASKGCPTVNGIATILDATGSNSDFLLVESKTGLEVFNGSYDEFPLTWKIDDVWRAQDWTALGLNQVICDPVNRLIFVFFTGQTGAYGTLGQVILIDYNFGLDYKNVRITTWQTNTAGNTSHDATLNCLGLNLTSAGVVLNIGITQISGSGWFKTTLGVAVAAGNDDNHGYQVFGQLGFIREPVGGLSAFNSLRLAAVGSGNLSMTGTNIAASSTTITAIALSGTPAEVYQIFNIVSEACSIKLTSVGLATLAPTTNYFEIAGPIRIWSNPLWANRNG